MTTTFMDYIAKAKSTDEYRTNLTSVYRDIDCFVATDGHRLHWINGQTKIEKGYYLDGRDADFPKWDRVMPQGVPIESEIAIDREALDTLKNSYKLFKKLVGKQVRVKLTFTTDSKVRIECEHKSLSLSLSFVLKGNTEKDYSIRVDLSYLIDAIELPVLNSPTKSMVFAVDFYGELSPWIVRTQLGNALIMPMRE